MCAMPRCARFAYGHRLCHRHYQRWRRHGDATVLLRRANGTAAGVRYAAHHKGYVMLGDGKGGLIAEHRVVWARHHGPIPPDFQVHHRNGVRDDNRIENLELLHIVAHTRHHAQPRDPLTGRFMSAP